MKKLILAAAILGLTGSVMAQQVSVGRAPLGSGSPGFSGLENATQWDNSIFHAPQYMPGYPTAATLFPRVVDVKCRKGAAGLECDGYNWTPEMGRGEYLMIRPVVVAEAKPVTNTIIKEVPVIVYKEVEKKKKGE